MIDLTTDLSDLLQQVQRPGSFYATGRVDIHTPRLEVTGVGTIALPLLPMQAEQLLEMAEPAPYGRGSETLVDREVRRTWQVDAGKVQIGGRRWEQDLAQILRLAARGLGVEGTVRAELYKLLVYDQGSFFVTHRDTEKAPGMFATLVIVLPCDYQGGELLIRHQEEEARIELRPRDPAEVSFAAFYADCRHEVLPVTAGHRLTLTYNLIRTGGGPIPQAPDYAPQQAQVTDLLRKWPATLGEADGGPVKLVYPLEHAYTQAELDFSTLKGADAAVAAVVVAASEAADCDCHLALLTIEESGWAEYAGGWDENEYEIGEVTDYRWTLEHWCRPDGGKPTMSALPFEEKEVSPPEALDDLEDTETEFSEATGNEGVSFERFYQRAALVLWPRTARALVVTGGGLEISVPFFIDLVRRWEEGGRDPKDGLRQEALELAEQIRRAWPTQAWARKQASDDGHSRTLLGGLARLGDLAQRIVFIADQGLDGAYGPMDNPALAELFGQLPPERSAGLLAALISGNGPRLPAACAQLLRLCTELTGIDPDTLRSAAAALRSVLPDGASRTDEQGGYSARSQRKPNPELVVDSLIALERIDSGLALQALELFLSLPKLYPLDELLLPAALILHETAIKPEPATFAHLRRAVLTHLERRITEPLEPPTDWTRPAEVTCTCNRCSELNRFLATPDMPRWGLKAAAPERGHVEEMVRQHRCDLDLRTEKRGRPYTLMCIKNQASYQRRVEQRQRDLEQRKRLGG